MVFLFPILWLVLSCFSANGSIYSFNGFFPTSFSFDSFKNLFTDTKTYNYPSWFGYTLLVAVISSVVGTLLVILTAFTISSFQFSGRKILMKGALVLGMFPSFMGMTAVYLLMTQFGFINNHVGLALIYAGGAPMGYLVQKGFFDTIPSSIYEAARIDGASNLHIFARLLCLFPNPLSYILFLPSLRGPGATLFCLSCCLKIANCGR